MPKKSKSKNINRAQKREQWYIKKTVSDEFVALLCNLINDQLIICSPSYLSLFIFHFFTPKITQHRKITYIDPLTMHQFQFTPKKSSDIVRTKLTAFYPSKKVGLQGSAQFHLLRKELFLINAREFFVCFCFLLELKKNDLTAHSRIATKIDNLSHPPSQPRASLL